MTLKTSVKDSLRYVKSAVVSMIQHEDALTLVTVWAVAAALIALVIFTGGCAVTPPVVNPQPAPSTTWRVDAVACANAGTTPFACQTPIAGATIQMHGPTGYITKTADAAGYAVFELPAPFPDSDVTVTAEGYVSIIKQHIDVAGTHDSPRHNIVTLTLAHVAPTLTQSADFQGDLMLWIPELTPNFVDGVDPVTGIRERADSGATPRGIHAGWVWTLWTPFYPPAQRQQIYAAAKAEGYTHFALHVAQCLPSPGYHGLRPMAAADCAASTDQLNTTLRELGTAGLIRVCAGVSSTQPLQAGVDATLCDVAMTDWDDWDQADCQIDAVARAFPTTTPIYFEQPPDTQPRPDTCTPPGLLPAADGGAWIRAATRRHPNFTGVLLETNHDGVDADTAVITAAYRWWRDLQVVLFETDTYQKFWDNLDHDAERAYNDTLRQRTPTLHGFMSGGTTHVPPSNDHGESGTFAGELDLHQATLVHIASDFADWPVTTTIRSITFGPAGMHVDFDKADGPNRWPDVPFGNPGDSLQYTIGLAEQINGQWYASAPIQMWYAEPRGGGDITLQDLNDNTHRGQIQGNWFYDNRWGTMQGYQPKSGETIGLFLCAGNCRDGDASRSFVHERSNVVLLPLPAAPGIVVTAR